MTGATLSPDEQAEKASELGLKPSSSTMPKYPSKPRISPLFPGLAIMKVLEQNGMTYQDVDLIEINEAFAAVVRTSARSVLGMSKEADARQRSTSTAVAIAYGAPHRGNRRPHRHDPGL